MNNIFAEATRLKLRVNTTHGPLSIEQLWDLSLNKLAVIIKNAKKALKKDDDDELSFLDESKVVDKELQLTFDILKEIYLTKKAEQDAQKAAVSKKAHNEKVMALIAAKQEQELSSKSIEELEALLMT